MSIVDAVLEERSC